MSGGGTQAATRRGIPEVSLLDNLRFNLGHVLPFFARGIFLRSQVPSSALSALGINPFSHGFAADLRARYGSSKLYLNMAGRKTLLLLDTDDVRHVLDHSPDVYAENDLKRRGMSHFQPHSLTLSRGDAWVRRRAFNERALESDARVHSLAPEFAAGVQRAVLRGDASGWSGLHAIFEAITLSVVFGHSSREVGLSRRQRRLMRQANRVFLLKPSARQARLAAEIRRTLQAPDPEGLVGPIDLPHDNHGLQAENQVPHWMFAIRDTLAANVARALALVTSHPEALEAVRSEIAGANLAKPEDIDHLEYVEGCLQEAMRLWPTTPLLARESIRRDQLGGHEIPAKTQVVVFNQYLHRDADAVPEADRFRPGRWQGRRSDPQFNHMSNGRQVCAGRNLALFLGKAALANLVDRGYALAAPRIDPRLPVPDSYDCFRLRFDRR